MTNELIEIGQVDEKKIIFFRVVPSIGMVQE